MLDKILKILNVVTQVILLLTAFLSIFMAYIIFAPDELPKPFRLQYQYDAAFTTPVPSAHEPVAAEATAAAESHEYIPGEGIMLNMSTKIINLVDPGGRRYIRLTVVAEFAPDNPEFETLPEEEKIAYETAFEEKLNSRLPIMDDTVITLLSTKTYEDLYTSEGKEKLRLEIMEILSEKLVDLHLLAIYFTEFVVQ